MFLIANQVTNEPPLIIRKEFQEALTKEGFIEDLLGENEVEITESNPDAGNNKITIQDLNNEIVKGIWKVNLEMEIAGISSKNTSKTVECALLVLTHQEGHSIYNLHIILIELKTTLTDAKNEGAKIKISRLQDYEEKFTATMNRLYMLLSLNEHRNDKYYQHLTIKVNFIGLASYKQDEMTRDDGTQLYKILHNTAENNILTCKTIMSYQDKIKIYFSTKDIISLNELI